MSADDRRLAADYLAGKRHAHRVVDEWIQVVVRHRAWRLVGDGDDLRQEVHVRLLERLGDFRAESALKTFVQAVAKHVCIDALRRQRVRQTDALGEEQIADQRDQPDEDLERRQRWQLCYRVLSELSDSCRQLFRLLLVEGSSYEDIASQLDVPMGTVKSRLSRCRDQAVAIRRRFERTES